MKWSSTKLIAGVSLAVIYVLLSTPGYSLTLITGIPAFSGVINTFIQAVMLVLVVSILRTPGAATLVSTLYGVLSLPLPSLGGPGFLPKILIGFLVGVLVDLVWLATRSRERLAALSIAIVAPTTTGFLIVAFGTAAGIPGIERLAKLFYSPLAIIYAVIFGLLGLFSLRVYQRLATTAVVKRIQR